MQSKTMLSFNPNPKLTKNKAKIYVGEKDLIQTFTAKNILPSRFDVQNRVEHITYN